MVRPDQNQRARRMTDIPTSYYDRKRVRKKLAASPDGHRAAIGGMWDEIGQLQYDFLLAEGLKPAHRLIDIGCGSFRAGVKLAPYLQPEHYFGIDISPDILKAGYQQEIVAAGLKKRFPRSNWREEASFDIGGFGVMFDFGIAQSVFTHLPPPYLERCLATVAPAFHPGGRLYLTLFECPPDHDIDQPLVQQPGGRTTYRDKDPYHYRVDSLAGLAGGLWDVRWIGEWNHPRAQKMALFTRR